MKRCFFLFLLILCLRPCLAGAEEDDALYPIRENGLWGYMNRQGETVIAPQWEYAGLFSDGVAVVGRMWKWDLVGGLIREDGKMLLPMEYCITETVGGFIFSLWDDSAGSYRDQWFFDKASMALFPIPYDSVLDWYGGDLLIAENASGEHENELYGFIRRDTGEVVFPLQFDGLYDDVGCREGYVLAAYELGYQGDGSVWGPDYHLYALTGEEIVFPFGIKPDSCVHDGVLRITRELTEEERISHPSGWGTVYGLGNPDGTVAMEPQYDHLEFAGDGLISTYLDGKCGLIDLTGREIVPPRYQISTGGELPMIAYRHGYAQIDDAGENWRETERYVIIDTEGNEVFSRSARADSFSLASLVLENGLIWYQENGLYGLMRITDDGAEYLTEPRYESYVGGVFDTEDLENQIDFAEGLHPIRMNGLWGYINERAETVIQSAWDAASSFRDGLALVEKDGKLAYIDHAGDVVWQETEEGKSLYAVKDENGLWGYIDCKGNLVIPGTFTWAEDFRGDYAMVRQIPDGEPIENQGYYGVIDIAGQWVLPPAYYEILSESDSGDYACGRDTGIFLVTDGWKKGSKQGFFDIPSGFFSGLIYDDVHVVWAGNTDREYIRVTTNGKLGFASRKTGEIVVPCQYSPDDSRDFSGDYCMVMPYKTKVADGWILIDRQGKKVPLPENYYAVSTFYDGLAVIWDSVRDLYGYIDTAGNVVIEPQYKWAYAFSEGLACVKLQTDEWAMIAPDGGTVFVRWDIGDAHNSSMYCSHGLIRCGAPDNGPVIFLNKTGEEVFRLEIDGLEGLSDFKENGVAFYEAHSDQPNEDGSYGVGLFNDKGDILTPPIFWIEDSQWRDEFSDGLFPVVELSTGKMGYIDEQGQWAFPPVNGYCQEFRDGLARIAHYPEVIFMDREGNMLYRFMH